MKKCSLSGLENRDDLSFYRYPWDQLCPDLSSYIVLSLDAPPLTEADKDLGLFLIDGTWRYAKRMFASLPLPFVMRSLPADLKTAYPRRQEDCSDPERGLATVEALYASYRAFGRDTKGLLDHYYWKEEFLKKNDFS